MKLAILGPRKRGYEEERFIEEGRKIFDRVDYFPIPRIIIRISNKEKILSYGNKNLLEYEAILPRIPRSYKTYGFTLLTILKSEEKYLPIDPFSVILSHNKFLTLVCLAEKGLPVPKTFLSLKRNTLEETLDQINFPLVLKLLYGSKGIGVMFADSKQSAISIMDTLERFKQPIFIEEYVENPGEDVRAYVIGNEVFAMKRIAKKDERRANISIGGKGEVYKLKDEEIDLVLDAADALNMEICGVDFIPSYKGPLFIETNVNAQFKGLERATKVNIARKILEFLKERVEK